MKAEDFVSSDDIPLEVETLCGDVRDALLIHLRSIKVPWAMLAEDEQSERMESVEKTAKEIIRKVVHLVAEQGFPHVEVQIGKTSFDKNLEMKVIAQASVDNIGKIASHGKMGAVLVLAEAADFLGERGPASPDKDQPDLPLAAE